MLITSLEILVILLSDNSPFLVEVFSFKNEKGKGLLDNFINLFLIEEKNI